MNYAKLTFIFVMCLHENIVFGLSCYQCNDLKQSETVSECSSPKSLPCVYKPDFVQGSMRVEEMELKANWRCFQGRTDSVHHEIRMCVDTNNVNRFKTFIDMVKTSKNEKQAFFCDEDLCNKGFKAGDPLGASECYSCSGTCDTHVSERCVLPDVNEYACLAQQLKVDGVLRKTKGCALNDKPTREKCETVNRKGNWCKLCIQDKCNDNFENFKTMSTGPRNTPYILLMTLLVFLLIL